MTVVAILGVLAAAGFPAFTHMKQRYDVNAMVSALSADIRLAKVEAVKRGRTVTLCPSATPSADQPACSGAGADWALGWVMFVDDGVTPGDVDAGETIIRAQQDFPGTGRIFNGNLTAVRFQATGLPVGMAASSFTITPDEKPAGDSPLSAVLTMSAPGRVVISQYKAKP
jgi:type IV fimbrial biogenesis protein FimT